MVIRQRQIRIVLMAMVMVLVFLGSGSVVHAAPSKIPWPTGWSLPKDVLRSARSAGPIPLYQNKNGDLYAATVDGTGEKPKIVVEELTDNEKKQLTKIDAQNPQRILLTGDETGQLYVAWLEQIGVQYGIKLAILREGQTQILDVVTSTGVIRDPALTERPGGGALVAWASMDDGPMGIFVKQIDSAGQFIGAPLGIGQRLSPEGSYAHRPAVTYDEQGNIHALWVGRANDDWYVHYGRFDQQAVPLGPDQGDQVLGSTGSEERYKGPAIKRGPNGAVHMVWSDNIGILVGQGVIYAQVSSSGEFAVRPTVVVKSKRAVQAPDFYVAERGTVYVVWCDDRTGSVLIHQTELENGKAITPVKSISFGSQGHTMPMVVGSQGGRDVYYHYIGDSMSSFVLAMVTDRYPTQPSMTYRLGLDPYHPVSSALYSYAQLLTVTGWTVFAGTGVIVLAVGVYLLLRRVGFFGRPGQWVLELLFLTSIIWLMKDPRVVFYLQTVWNGARFELVSHVMAVAVTLVFMMLNGLKRGEVIEIIAGGYLYFFLENLFTQVPQFVNFM